MNGLNVCRNHGGAAGRAAEGPLNASYRHGRHSKLFQSLPVRYRDDYLAALNDPNVLSLEKEIALIDARLVELMERVQGSGGTWQQAQSTFEAVIAAMQKEDQAAIRTALLAHRDLLQGNLSNDKEWREWVSPDIEYVEQCPGLPKPPDAPNSPSPRESARKTGR